MTAKLKGIKDSMLPLEGKLEKIGAPKIKKQAQEEFLGCSSKFRG